ncbi:MAG: tRNA1(Val) (adenine(37)-N6)-methyltransferase [Thermodesulfobacteriota bacterium]
MPSAHATDTFFNGKLTVRQDRDGYRFSIDAILLAGHITPRPGDRIVDLGTGCGILPLILAYRFPQIRIVGLEIQPALAVVARDNVLENRLSDRIEIRCADMRKITAMDFPRPVDMVITNPPYRKSESGRINPDRQRAVARHEIEVTLEDVVDAAVRILRTSGKFIAVYPALRAAELIHAMRASGIEPKKLRTVHSRNGDDAKLVLVEGRKGAGAGLTVSPPLFIYREEDDAYTEEVNGLFQP